MTMSIKAKLWRFDARLPVFAKEGDACADLCAGDEQDVTVIYSGETKVVYTALSLEIPAGYEGLVRGRSGLSSKGIHVQQGVIDSNYRGRIGVIVHNTTSDPVAIKRNDRIAQLAIRQAPEVSFELVDELGDSNRGHDGWGSTGL